MAAIDTFYIGLTRQAKTAATVETTTKTLADYANDIATAESLNLNYYIVSLERNPSFNSLSYPSETLSAIETALGITLVNGDVFISTPFQTNLTKEQKQIQKLNIAAATRSADGDPRSNYDLSQLPNPYNGNLVDPDETSNFGGLVQGRPWTNLEPGLYRTTYDGYFADDPLFFLIPTTTLLSEGADTGAIVETRNDDTFSEQWVGYFKSPVTGPAVFNLTSDDASYMWLGTPALGPTVGNALINNGGLHGPTPVDSAVVALNEGVYYPIRIMYGENTVAQQLTVSFSAAGYASVTDWTGFTFHNPTTKGF